MFMAAASFAGVVTVLDAVGAFGAQAVQHGARGLDAEAVRAFEVLRQFIEHMAFERAGRAALKADELAVRGGLGAADIAVARAPRRGPWRRRRPRRGALRCGKRWTGRPKCRPASAAGGSHQRSETAPPAPGAGRGCCPFVWYGTAYIVSSEKNKIETDFHFDLYHTLYKAFCQGGEIQHFRQKRINTCDSLACKGESVVYYRIIGLCGAKRASVRRAVLQGGEAAL